MLARAHWKKTGLADSTQLWEGSFWPKPSLHTITSTSGDRSPHTGTSRPTAWLGRVASDRMHRGVAVPGSPLRTELSSLGYAGVYCSLTPTPEFWPIPILSFAYSFAYPSFWWTCPAGTLSTLNTFLTAADLGSCLKALSPFSLLCPGKEKPVQYSDSYGEKGL